jgi:hypothetical protein
LVPAQEQYIEVTFPVTVRLLLPQDEASKLALRTLVNELRGRGKGVIALRGFELVLRDPTLRRLWDRLLACGATMDGRVVARKLSGALAGLIFQTGLADHLETRGRSVWLKPADYVDFVQLIWVDCTASELSAQQHSLTRALGVIHRAYNRPVVVEGPQVHQAAISLTNLMILVRRPNFTLQSWRGQENAGDRSYEVLLDFAERVHGVLQRLPH